MAKIWEGITEMSTQSTDNWQMATGKDSLNPQLTTDNCSTDNRVFKGKRSAANWPPRGAKRCTDATAEHIADKLSSTFNDRKFYKWYLSAAYRLGEARIWQIYEEAQSGKQPAHLFSYLLKRELARQGDSGARNSDQSRRSSRYQPRRFSRPN
jgi:hypothetical protein